MNNVQDFVLKKKDYLYTQVGNPEGSDKPNKKVSSDSGRRRASLRTISSSMILVSGSVRAKRHSRSASRLHAMTLATLVSGFTGTVSEQWMLIMV